MQTHFTTLCLWWLRSRCFPNPCQSDIWWLMTARRNSYQPVLVRIFRNCAIVEAWLPFMTCRKCIHDVENMYPQNITVRLKFSVHDICKLWSHYSHYKHDLHDYREALWWVLHPLFPWGDKVIDHDTSIYIEWHNIIHGNRKKRQSLLFREIGSGPGPSSPSCFFSLAWWLKPNTHTPGLSWSTIIRQIHDTFPCIQTTTSVQQCFSEN